jgi:hypothetical protein
VAEPGHEFLGGRARGGGERPASVPQVVKVHAGHASPSACLGPDQVEVATSEPAATKAEIFNFVRNDFGTGFGPTNTDLHAVAVEVELGDAGHAIDLAHAIESERLSAERQARYAIDLAHAHAMRRQIGESLQYLQLAEELTPEQTRSHRIARAVARDLLQLSGTRMRPELRELAERFGVAS